MQLTDKVAIVTGGASGFGAAIATRLCKEGCAVMLADINEKKLQETTQTLLDSGARVTWQQCDVTKETDYQSTIEATQASFGGLDIVVNNAGTTHHNKPALSVTEEEFDQVFRVNLKSIFWSAKFALPVFARQRQGVMVNIASTTGVRPGPGLTWYSGSKAAMINLTKGLALEFAKDGIRINAVNPMIGETPMMEAFMGMTDTPESREKFLARIPLGRFTKPDDVANAVLFLASAEAEFLTGVCLDVDGGRNI
tara:strand:- start:70698 stop:71456 length:759 start_codon:yes stop_codon:yes gene_type:complete